MQLLLKRKLCEFYDSYDAEFYQLIGQYCDKFFTNLKNLSVLKYFVLNQQVNKFTTTRSIQGLIFNFQRVNY